MANKKTEDLDSLLKQRKELNQQLKDLPAKATKRQKNAIQKKIDAIDKALDRHKEESTAQGVLKIQFLKSPTGRFGLGYAIGETGEVEAGLAQKCVDAGYAKHV